MRIEGEHRFDASRQQVWEALMDPEVIRGVMPGCEDLRPVGDGRFEGVLKMKVGPVQGVFKGSVELSDLEPPTSYRMRMKGQGGPGFVDGSGTIGLRDDGAGTVVTYRIDAQVGGRVASIGQRLLDSSSRVLARQALEGLEKQLAARAAGATVEAPPPPSQGELAGRLAKGVLGELIPARSRRWLLGAAALLALAVLSMWLRTCSG